MSVGIVGVLWVLYFRHSTEVSAKGFPFFSISSLG